MIILCTICSDIVNQAENIFVTKCGHVFHHHCLAQWIERSKTCPQCRNKVTEKCMFRLYPTLSSDNSDKGDDAATLQSRLDDAQLRLRQQKATFKEKEDKLAAVAADLKKNEDLVKTYEKKLVSCESKMTALREQLLYANVQVKETEKLKQENDILQQNIQMLNGLQKVLNATSEEVEQMLKGYSDLRTVATFATALKRALSQSELKRSEERDRLHTVKQHLATEKKHSHDYQLKILRLEDEIGQIKHDLEQAKREKPEVKTDMDIQITMNQCIRSSSTTEVDLNQRLETDFNNSFNSVVNRIENSDSPYLTLKQSSVMSLSALQRQPVNIADNRLKPSELIFMNAVKVKKPSNESKPSTSIFHMKETITIKTFDEPIDKSNSETSYDGLGGHSKLDKFPVPKLPVKSLIPKLSAKHKLKRPNGAQDIGQMLKKSKDT